MQALREFKKNIAAVKVDDLDIKLDNKSTAGGWEEVGLVGAEQQAPDQPVVKTEQGTNVQNADGESSESSLLPDHDICVYHTWPALSQAMIVLHFLVIVTHPNSYSFLCLIGLWWIASNFKTNDGLLHWHCLCKHHKCRDDTAWYFNCANHLNADEANIQVCKASPLSTFSQTGSWTFKSSTTETLLVVGSWALMWDLPSLMKYVFCITVKSIFYRCSCWPSRRRWWMGGRMSICSHIFSGLPDCFRIYGAVFQNGTSNGPVAVFWDCGFSIMRVGLKHRTLTWMSHESRVEQLYGETWYRKVMACASR